MRHGMRHAAIIASLGFCAITLGQIPDASIELRTFVGEPPATGTSIEERRTPIPARFATDFSGNFYLSYNAKRIVIDGHKITAIYSTPSVMKLDPDGRPRPWYSLSYANITALAVDGGGNVYRAGVVNGVDTAPTPGAFQTSGGTGYVLKLSPDGSLL